MRKPFLKSKRPLPDVAMDIHDEPQGAIDWVGMSQITAPFVILDQAKTSKQQCTVQVYVDLTDAHAKGIHMSRLYRALGKYQDGTVLTPDRLTTLLGELQHSHGDLSTKSHVEIRFDYALQRSALITDNVGWNRYPTVIRGTHDGKNTVIDLEFWVSYSSTCPASSALSRQAIQQQFDVDFPPEGEVDRDQILSWLGSQRGIVATPHSQRSVAKIHTRLDEHLGFFPITDFIDMVEQSLGTPVQTAVKREDEQEFAIRNAQNPMFCEDAVRRISTRLQLEDRILDFLVRVEHYESLHAHNAVSIAAKGVKNGFKAVP